MMLTETVHSNANPGKTFILFMKVIDIPFVPIAIISDYVTYPSGIYPWVFYEYQQSVIGNTFCEY